MNAPVATVPRTRPQDRSSFSYGTFKDSFGTGYLEATPRSSLPAGAGGRRPSSDAIKLRRSSLFIPETIDESRRRSLAPELPAGPAFGEEPPFTLHRAMVPKLSAEYQAWYNEYLIDHKYMVNTHLYDPKLLRQGGKTVPGPSPPLDLPTKDFEVPGRDDNPDVPVRVWWPTTEMPEGGWPVFIWAHGGGWILGSKNTENNFTTRMAEWAKCCVISVGYRLAPECPFPDCLYDFWDVVIWANENPHLLNINPNRVAIGGSSAGGNIASVISHQYADSGLPPLALQMLLVPVTDNTACPETHLSWKENEFTPQLPAAKMMVYREYYLPDPDAWVCPEASPIFYPDESFKLLPPALVVSASCDVLRTENEIYAAKIKKAGVPVTHKIYKSVPHHVMGCDLVLTQGREIIKDCSRTLRHVFYGHDDLVIPYV